MPTRSRPNGGAISKRRLAVDRGHQIDTARTLFDVLLPVAPPARALIKICGMTATATTLCSANPSRRPTSGAPRGPATKPFAEQHRCHSISYVPRQFRPALPRQVQELVAGSVLIGHPGDEFTCPHDHVCATSACRSS